MTYSAIFIVGTIAAILVLAATLAFTVYQFRFMAKHPESFVHPEFEDELEEELEKSSTEFRNDTTSTHSS